MIVLDDSGDSGDSDGRITFHFGLGKVFDDKFPIDGQLLTLEAFHEREVKLSKGLGYFVVVV